MKNEGQPEDGDQLEESRQVSPDRGDESDKSGNMTSGEPGPETPAGENEGHRATRWTRTLLFVLLTLALVYVLLARYRSRGDHGQNHAAVGTQLETLRLEPLGGNSQLVQLEDLSGQVVLVNYWGTWCPPCRVEFPHVLTLYNKYRGRDRFRLLSVSCFPSPSGDKSDLQRDTSDFLARMDADLPTHEDLQAISRRGLMEAAGLDGFAFPTTVLLDGQGTIRGLWIGYMSGYEVEMDEAISELLSRNS